MSNVEKTRESSKTFISYTSRENQHFYLNVKMLEKTFKFSIFILTHSVLVLVKSSLKILVIFLSESTVYKMLEGELFFEY